MFAMIYIHHVGDTGRAECIRGEIIQWRGHIVEPLTHFYS